MEGPDRSGQPDEMHLWREAFDAVAAGLAILDSQSRVTHYNRALLALLGTDDVSDIDAQLFGGHPIVRSICDEVRNKGHRSETSERSEDGRVFVMNASPLAADRVVLAISDLTESERLETRLIQSEKMAAVGQLVSGVAHELNNPLASISGLAELLLERAVPGTREMDHLRVILEESTRAGEIVRNLLTFARRDSGSLAPVNLNEVVRNAYELVRYELKMLGISCNLELDNDLPTIDGERVQLQLVVLNILSNAKHALAGQREPSPEVIVRTSCSGGSCMLQISDNGPGIPQEDLTKIFTPFFTTKAPGEGTGLGLALAYAIVERFGGRISADNRPDRGAILKISFPVGTARSTEAGQHEPGVAVHQPSNTGERHRMLLLDDDPGIRRVVRAVFSDLGLEVLTTQLIEAGLAMLSREQFSVILADPRAAVNPGTTLAAWLAERPDLLRRTIFLQADVDAGEAGPDHLSKAAGFLNKPFKVSDLRKLVEGVISSG